MAQLHARCFTHTRPWGADEFAKLLAQDHIISLIKPYGFALVRMIAPESELLTIAIDPKQQGKGHGRALLKEVLASAQQAGAQEMMLEVGENNRAAIALYEACGFCEISLRPKYYKLSNGDFCDAKIMHFAFSN